MYLQRPDYVRCGAGYNNPHLLKLSSHQLPFEATVLVAEEKSTEDKEVIDTLKETMTEVYSSLTRSHNLIGLEGDERLQTRLLL